MAVNKIDNYDENLKYEYYELGLGDPMAISAEHGKGIGDLLDEVVKQILELESIGCDHTAYGTLTYRHNITV